MADRTGIEWTDATWNPVTGCTKVSPGCDHCYAERIVERFKGKGAFITVLRNEEKLHAPFTWRKPRRVFVNSMSDLFHDNVPDEFIGSVFDVMALTPQHTYQILTKRHARMRSLLRRWQDNGWTWRRLDGLWCGPVEGPLPNVWLGVSAENQQWADIRVPALVDTPAAVRFLSCEPLLGPLRVDRWLRPVPGCGYVEQGAGCCLHPDAATPECHTGVTCPLTDRWRGLDWVIVGGESGPGARPMHPAWARNLRDQCTAAAVPFFFKQWGEWGPAPWSVRVCDPAVGWQGTAEELAAAKAQSEATGATHAYAVWAHEYGHEPHQPSHKPWSLERITLPDDTHAPIRRWGKRHAGRVLDGRTWDEYPQPDGGPESTDEPVSADAS